MIGGAVIAVSHNVVSNAFKLVAALAFLPVMFGIGRNIRIPEAIRKALILGVLAIVASFAMTAIDQQVGTQLGAYDLLFRWVRHLTVALGGCSFAWAAWKTRDHEIAMTGGHR